MNERKVGGGQGKLPVTICYKSRSTNEAFWNGIVTGDEKRILSKNVKWMGNKNTGTPD